MKRFILQENLARFRKLLDEEADANRRRTLQVLISEARRELAAFNAEAFGARLSDGPFRFVPQAAIGVPADMPDLSRFRQEFETASRLFLLVDPRAGLHIVDANTAYAEATLIDRGRAAGERMFDVFPDNPEDPLADGVSNLFNSLQAAAETGRTHVMRPQRYDIRDAEGRFVERYWRPVNRPIFDDDGRLVYLLHEVEDVTAQMLAGAKPDGDEDAAEREAFVDLAFEKALPFVERNPVLRSIPSSRIRARLRRHIETLAEAGERDLLAVIDQVIRDLYGELARSR